MEITQEQKLYGQIVQKAWEDATFKAELVANPLSAIEKLIGQKLNLPQGKTLLVRDQTDEGTVYINLPTKVNTEDVELNEEQLETVAGGSSLWPIIIGPWVPTPTFPITTVEK
ncbi:NHLP leader peptide family RiPP precursor [Spirosoma sp. RP8]|uniref:NHLP leader peptide family RiPP n=1 Tax=Spirosoma liriopis TaxID=2937440 RepID=A0ABT0HV13_9BACT|nr:NHLP leader peptide family RiPP precursor [Spirosoma liriopis]MCK8496021.1 NHLP leader peptide family RiPP precursor [Spirosoma liriopis]